MKELNDLIDDLIENKVELSVGLLKAKKMNLKLNDSELQEFVESESTGDYQDNKFPEFRKIRCTPVVTFKNAFNGRTEINDTLLRLPDNFTKKILSTPISLIEKNVKEGKKYILPFTEGELQVTQKYVQNFLDDDRNEGWMFGDGYWRINNTAFQYILDTAKNKFIDILTRVQTKGEITSSVVNQKFYPEGTEFLASSDLIDILKLATKEIIVVDNFFTKSTLDLLVSAKPNVQIKVLTQQRRITPDLELLIVKFNTRHNKLEIKPTSAFHNRYIVIDGKDYYDYGASLKDAGKTSFTYSKLIVEQARVDFDKKFNSEWNKSSSKIKVNYLNTEQISIINQVNIIYDEFIKIGVQIEKHFVTDSYEDRINIRLNLFSRMLHKIESIKILFEDYQTNPYLEDSIAAILKGGLLDIITLLYLDSYWAEIKDDDDETYNKERDQTISFLSEHVHQSIDYIDSAVTAKIVSPEDRKVVISNLYNNNPGLFSTSTPNFENPKLDLIVPERFASVPKMIERIYTHPVATNFIRVPDYYEYFLKYEQFGIMTNFLQTNDIDNSFKVVIFSLGSILAGTLISAVHCSNVFNIKVEVKQLTELAIEHRKFLDTLND